MKAHREHVYRKISESLVCFSLDDDRFNSPYHYHPEIELTLILEGAGTRMIGDSVKTFGPGDLCLIGGGIPHLYSSGPQVGCRARAEIVQLQRDEWSGMIDSLPEMQSIADLLDRSGRALQFSQELFRPVAEGMQRLRQSIGVRRVVSLIELLELLANKQRETQALVSPGFSAEIDNLQSRRIEKACRYIIEHSSEAIAHADIAAKVGLSRSGFSRLFRKATRMTFTEFLTQVRLGHAARLLLETQMPVTEVAFGVGFANLSNFNRRFRHLYNCTPSEYRRMATPVPEKAIAAQKTD